MSGKIRRKWFLKAIEVALGFVCAVVLGVLFYSAMAYQTAEPQGASLPDAHADGAYLAIAGAQLLSERTAEVEYGGAACTQHVCIYQLEDGSQAEAITAKPAAYLERMAQEQWTPQLITGFVLAQMDAVYALRGEECLLAARDEDTVYMIRAKADEQAAYALGVQAYLETPGE